MKTIIIGAGRLGAALALRSASLGHDTCVLCRDADSPTVHPLPAEIQLEEITAVNSTGIEIVIIAAPGHADPFKERLVGEFLRSLPSATAICSAVAYPGAPHEAWGASRPYLRFLCTPAMASLEHKPTALILNGNRATQTQFLDWLGPADVLAVQAGAFDRLSSLLMAAAVHLETARQFLGQLEGGATATEQRFVASTLRESAILLELFGYSPAGALDACSTPHGLAREMVAAFRVAIGEAAGKVIGW